MKTSSSSIIVGIKYCGNCNPRYDRKGMLDKIRNQCSPTTIFMPVFGHEDVEYDFILVVCGCQAQCADRSKLKSKNGLFGLYQDADPNVAIAKIRELESAVII